MVRSSTGDLFAVLFTPRAARFWVASDREGWWVALLNLDPNVGGACTPWLFCELEDNVSATLAVVSSSVGDLDA